MSQAESDYDVIEVVTVDGKIEKIPKLQPDTDMGPGDIERIKGHKLYDLIGKRREARLSLAIHRAVGHLAKIAPVDYQLIIPVS